MQGQRSIYTLAIFRASHIMLSLFTQTWCRTLNLDKMLTPGCYRR